VFNLGMSEIVVILVVALVFLGPKKLPELASGIGKMIRELRKATADIKNEIELDETIRKPVEELREAMTLHPEELKRRDAERAARKREEEEQKAREKAEKEAADKAEHAAKAEKDAPRRPSPLRAPFRTA
jgi:Tat protein translocase TatB subunit